MQRSVCAFDPETGTELARLSCTVQPHLAQLSDLELINEGRREFVRLHALAEADARAARYEVHED